jgi:hypothetical protein
MAWPPEPPITHLLITEQSIPVQVRYVYAGDSDAYVTGIAANIVRTKNDIIDDEVDFTHRMLEPPIVVKSGEHGFRLTEEKISTIRLFFQGDNLFCVGYIIHRDDNGIVRQTGFCRRYNVDTKRWDKVEDEDYEYAY